MKIAKPGRELAGRRGGAPDLAGNNQAWRRHGGHLVKWRVSQENGLPGMTVMENGGGGAAMAASEKQTGSSGASVGQYSQPSFSDSAVGE